MSDADPQNFIFRLCLLLPYLNMKELIANTITQFILLHFHFEQVRSTNEVYIKQQAHILERKTLANWVISNLF